MRWERVPCLWREHRKGPESEGRPSDERNAQQRALGRTEISPRGCGGDLNHKISELLWAKVVDNDTESFLQRIVTGDKT